MGTGSTKFNSYRHTGNVGSHGNTHFKEFSLTNFVGKLSGRSFGSSTSLRSTCSVSRPWSRISRRRWKESTLADPLNCVKTAWPVSLIESLFLPEFKVNCLAEDDYEVFHQLSKGAFGKVFKVLHKNTEEIYAMKILNKSKMVYHSASLINY